MGQKGFCSNYKCTVTPEFCRARRIIDDIVCPTCNSKDGNVRKTRSIQSRASSYRKMVALKIIKLKVDSSMEMPVIMPTLRKQQSTIANIALELNRSYKTYNIGEGMLLVRRVK